MKSSILTIFLITTTCAAAFSQTACDASLWQHVYKPERFTVWKRCTSVTGVIKAMKKEADGDFHIQMQIDPGQNGFINQRNIDAQKSCLVLEIICYNKVTQADATQVCKNCPENVQIPKVGDHVEVTGSFVKDLEANHGWNEIHPVSSIKAL
jgi:hypothetical protein